MTPKFRILALAVMGWGAAVSAQAETVGFESLAEDALKASTPLDLVPGSQQVPGFSFTGATVYHVDLNRPGPTDRGHLGFIQSRAANNSVNAEIVIELAGNLAGDDIMSIAFHIATPQMLMRLWAYDTAGTAKFFEFGSTSDPGPWEWTTGSFLFDSLGVVNRIKFERLDVAGAFALDDLNFKLAGTGGGGSVPEPAGLGLVVLALAAARLTTRKRKA